MAADTLQDMLLGEPVAGRECGDCIACCVIPGIDTPGLVKPEGVMCPHCTGRGCGVYGRRPDVCRTFHCAYRRIRSMPLETRPDKLGVMFTLERQLPPRNLFEHLYYVGVATGDSRALESETALQVIRMLTQGVLPVFVSHGGRKTLVHPEPDLAGAILNPAPLKDRALVKRGREWLKRYAPFARLSAGEHTALPYGL